MFNFFFKKTSPNTPPDIKGDINAINTTIGASSVDQAAHEAATSPLNDLPEPTQKERVWEKIKEALWKLFYAYIIIVMGYNLLELAGCSMKPATSTYSECILENMKGTNSNYAATEIAQACANKYPNTQ